MLCKVCGAQIPDDAQVCEFCGAQISESGDTRVIPSQEIEKQLDKNGENAKDGEIYDENERKRRAQMEKMMENKKQQLSEIEKRRDQKRRRDRRNKILLIALICVVALGAIGTGVYYIAKNVQNNNSVIETPAPTVLAAEPSASPTASAVPTPEQSPALSMATAAPNGGAGNSDGTQSWTPTGNTGSGGSSSSASSSGASSSTSKSSTASSSSKSKGSTSSSSPTASVNTRNVQNSGITTNEIASQLSAGGEVIYNTGTGGYLMTFITGGVKYYAHVSEGSTTEQIKGKAYTVTAQPTNETYNGNTVYEITNLTKYDGADYIIPDSGTRLLTESDLAGMSKYDLALARNEIYARHGRKFQTEEYSAYFNSKSWYSLNPNYDYSDDGANLNDIEAKNVSLILKAERK